MQKIGKYEILEKIGSGGFGEVFKGYDPFIKRHVAVKTCHSDDREVRERFFQEAEIAGNLHHRNVTTVYEFGLEGDLPYLIQEYLSGEDLDRKIKRREYLPYPEKLYYLLQIARGLGYAHSQGVIHRDVKPANVRVLEDGTAKIMDFGIARLAQQESGLTQTGMTLGTAAYLSPEQIRGADVDQRTDVFSFGVLAYELLVYERPFKGKRISAILHQILDCEPAPLTDAWPEAPAAAVSLVERCLSKDPTGRFANGNELVQAIESVQRGGVVAPAAAAQPATAAPTAPTAPTAPAAPAPAVTAPTVAAAVSASGVTEPRLDQIEFSLGGPEPEPEPVPQSIAMAKRRSPLPWILALALIAATAAAGWWLGFGGRSPEPGEVVDLPAEPPAGPEIVDVAPPPEEPESAADPEPDAAVPEEGEKSDDTEPDAAEPAKTEPEEAEPEPPPPAEPLPGVVTIAAVDWTERMTVEIGGRTYPLVRARELSLPPGTYPTTFAVDLEGYSARQTIPVQVVEGGKHGLRSPIPEPGSLSVRAYPGRPQGQIWLDGELLERSPIRRLRRPPGEYRIEIRPLAGDGEPLSRQITVASGQETIVSFDLGGGEIEARSKPLAR